MPADDDGRQNPEDKPSFHDAPTQMGTDVGGPAPGGESPWPGRTLRLAGRYQLEEVIASGGAAMVWRAFDHELSRSVAVKLLHPHLAGDEVTVERFRLESVNAARLSHPNVVQIYDTGHERDVVYLVMEHVDGPSLGDVLERRGRLEPEVVAALGEQVAGALGEAHHHGVVHRDVKPGNILLTADGVAKVTDFGIAKALSEVEESLTSPGTLVGTAAYVAPEQLEGEATDARADVYGLGVVLYECLTGQPAFQGETASATAAARLTRQLPAPRQLRPDVPKRLDEIVVTATRIDPDERYRDGHEMASALAQVVTTSPSELTAGLVPDTTPEASGPASGRGGGSGPAGAATRPHGDAPTPPERTAPGATAGEEPADAPARGGGERSITRGAHARRLALAFLGGLVLATVAFLAARALQDTPASSPDPAAAAETVPITAAGDLDPFAAEPGEHAEQVPASHDGDPATAWTTELYRDDPRFGQIKPGVGVWFELREAREVAAVALEMTSPGVGMRLYAADEPHDELIDWGPPLAEATDVGEQQQISLSDPVSARYWLVWFTHLAPAGDGTFQAGLAEVRFLSP